MKRQCTKIFVISLKDSKDRRQNIKSQMKKLGLEFEFFDAVDCRVEIPNTYRDKIEYKKIRGNLGRDMTSGEIGCALSHAFVYEKLVKENISDAIIMEDDAILGQDFADLLRTDTFQQSSFDMIMLYHFHARVIESKLMKFFKQYNVGKIINYPCSTVAYYINKKVLTKLYNATRTIQYVADYPIDIARENVGAVIPRIVKHPKEDFSLLEQERKTKIDKKSQTSYYAFKRFGFISWLKYKINKPKSITVSENIYGE